MGVLTRRSSTGEKEGLKEERGRRRRWGGGGAGGRVPDTNLRTNEGGPYKTVGD